MNERLKLTLQACSNEASNISCHCWVSKHVFGLDNNNNLLCYHQRLSDLSDFFSPSQFVWQISNQSITCVISNLSSIQSSFVYIFQQAYQINEANSAMSACYPCAQSTLCYWPYSNHFQMAPDLLQIIPRSSSDHFQMISRRSADDPLIVFLKK